MMKRILGALVGLATFVSTAHADPSVPTFTVSVPTPLTVLESGSHDLEVSYAFTGDDLVNAQVEVDLPPGVLVISVSDNQPFATHCTFQAPLPEGEAMDWRCLMTASLIDVGSGLSSRIVIRINPVIAFFEPGESLTFTARLTADNLAAPIEASTQTTVAVSALTLVDGPRVQDVASVESPFLDGGGQAIIGLATSVQRNPYNPSTAFLGLGVESRSPIAPGQSNYFLFNESWSWATDHTAWDLIESVDLRSLRLLGPVAIQTYSTPEGHRAEQYRSGSGASAVVWSTCDDIVDDSDLAAETWAPVSKADSTLELKSLGQDNSFYEDAPGLFTDLDCESTIDQLLPPNSVSASGTHGFGPAVGLPMGAVPLYDLFVVIELAPQLDYSYLRASTYRGFNSLAPVDLYACQFDSGDVDLARFEQSVGTDCTFLWRNDDPQAQQVEVPAGTTHVVAYDDIYFSDEPFGRTVYRYFYFTAEARIPCALAGQTLTHRSRAMARLTESGAPVDTGWAEVQDLVESNATLDDYGPVFRENNAFYGSPIVTATRGSTFEVMSELYNQGPGQNPEAVYTLPPGIRLVSADWIDDAFFGYDDGNCQSPELSLTEVANPDGTTTVTVTLRSAGAGDWFYVNQCAESDCAPAGRGDLRLQVYVDPSHPWQDGEAATFTSRWDIANNGWEGNTTQESILINVPDVLRLRIEPFCDGEGGGCAAGPEAGRRPGLRYTAENRSGRNLSDVIIEAYVPYVGDGVGTEVDATLFAIENPANLTLTCYDDSDTVVNCGATTRRVSALAPAMAPLEDRVLGLVFEVDTGATTGQRLYGRGSMRANELAEVPAAAVAPIRVNLCPGQLEALVYFDANGNGTRDSGELALPGWNFTFTDIDDVELTYEVGVDGELQIAMANGTYEWTAVRIASSDGAFVLGGDLDPIVICADELFRLEVPVTCVCPTISCNTSSCDLNGACTYTGIAGPLPGVLDDTCDWIDEDCDGQYSEDFVSTTQACSNGACTGTRTVSCGPNNQLQNGTCNAPTPQPEQCDGRDNDCDGLIDVADPTLVIPDCTDPWTGGALRGVCVGAVVTVDMCVDYGFGFSGWNGCWDREFLLSAYQLHVTASGQPGTYINPFYNGDSCDGLDNDCDGEVDEDFAPSAVSCQCGTVGTTTCEAGISGSTCPDFVPSPEICDGLDNDCDGLVDQADPDLVVPECESELGVCADLAKPRTLCAGEAGWLACGPADYAFAAFPEYRSDDDCDGVDNDCDGLIDEHFASYPVECVDGCSPIGTVACDEGELVDTCELGSGSPELCDGIDNDCDGLPDLSDPDLEAPLCGNQQGVCFGARAPLSRCGPSGWAECEVADYAAHGFPAYAVNDAVCDGLDNDCDGQVDEEFVGELKLCPPGSCQPVARDRCVGGALATGCEPSGPGCPTGPGAECEACSPATALYIYGIAEDQDGVPQGSFRCTRSPEGVLCDVDANGALEVTTTLWCGP